MCKSKIRYQFGVEEASLIKNLPSLEILSKEGVFAITNSRREFETFITYTPNHDDLILWSDWFDNYCIYDLNGERTFRYIQKYYYGEAKKTH